MKTSRRNFLQMFGAAIASLFAPKLEGDEVVIQDTSPAAGPIDTPASFGYPYARWEWSTDSVVDRVAWADETDLECDPDQLDKLNALFDSCECEPLKIEVHFDQCQKIEPGSEVYITRDWGETWELAGEIA